MWAQLAMIDNAITLHCGVTDGFSGVLALQTVLHLLRVDLHMQFDSSKVGIASVGV